MGRCAVYSYMGLSRGHRAGRRPAPALHGPCPNRKRPKFAGRAPIACSTCPDCSCTYQLQKHCTYVTYGRVRSKSLRLDLPTMPSMVPERPLGTETPPGAPRVSLGPRVSPGLSLGPRLSPGLSLGPRLSPGMSPGLPPAPRTSLRQRVADQLGHSVCFEQNCKKLTWGHSGSLFPWCLQAARGSDLAMTWCLQAAHGSDLAG